MSNFDSTDSIPNLEVFLCDYCLRADFKNWLGVMIHVVKKHPEAKYQGGGD